MKIKLATNLEIAILACESLEEPKVMLLVTVEKGERTLSDFETIFADPNATKKITLLDDDDQELALYTNYTKMISLNYDPENLAVSIGIERADETALRLADLEEQMTDAQMALCDIYEILVG